MSDKKYITTFFLLLMLVTPAAASPESAKKLQRGVVNVLTAPVEVPKQVRSYWIAGARRTPHIIVWIFSGAVKGLVNTVARGGSGIWDAVTFPWPCPKDHKALFQPEYVFQEWPMREKSDQIPNHK